MGAPSPGYDFNKEEDVKVYLDNIGIEYRFGCYSEKKPNYCHLLGDYLEVIKNDFTKAAKVYKANCLESSFPRSCFKYAGFKYLGRGTSKNLKDALSYYEKGCSSECPDSCLNGGLMCVSSSELGEALPKDYKKGIEMLNKACEYKNAFSCHYLGGMHITGVPNELDVNFESAFKYSLKACDLNNAHACANVSQMYRKGEGVTKDVEKANEYKAKSLNLEKEYHNAKDLNINK